MSLSRKKASTVSWLSLSTTANVFPSSAGNDVFTWNPGDGSGAIEGGAGIDNLDANGSDADDTIALSANRGRARLLRSVDAAILNVNDVERIRINALGGADTVVVNDLVGTDVRKVTVDLAGTLGGTGGDGQIDRVKVTGTGRADVLTVGFSFLNNSLTVSGLTAAVSIVNADLNRDKLIIATGGGDDIIDASGVEWGQGIRMLEFQGGAGNDRILGSRGGDTLIGGIGNDQLFGGLGEDLFVQNVGDGRDTIEGGFGHDTLNLNGDGANETIVVAANGERVRLSRNGVITTDMDDIAFLNVNALGGADTIVLNTMAGTDLKGDITVNLAGTLGGTAGDGQVDKIVINGSSGKNSIHVRSSGNDIEVLNYPSIVLIRNAEAMDKLVIAAGDDDDLIYASDVVAGKVQIEIQGGAGNDLILGSLGSDTLIGDDGDDQLMGMGGNDKLFGGSGNDTFFACNPSGGNCTIEGGAGIDAAHVLALNVDESDTIILSTSSGRVHAFRDVDAATMDVNDVERIKIYALGGADTIIVNSLAGTEVEEVAINLAGTFGGTTGDGAVDTVVVNGTAGGDVVNITSENGIILIAGLAAEARIQGIEAALDQLVVNAGDGNDVIDASGMPAGSIRLTLDGGAGDDILTGSDGADTLFGGEGNDLMFGGRGRDVVALGAGDDIFRWDAYNSFDRDTVEGGAGQDTLVLNGDDSLDDFLIRANGARAHFVDHLGFSNPTIAIDFNDIERIDINIDLLDTVTVNDMAGTDVTEVNINLAGEFQDIVVNGTAGGDTINISAADGTVTVSGLAATTHVRNADGLDQLFLFSGDGNDVINASAMPAGSIELLLVGGGGNDMIQGSQGNDLLAGGIGNDVLSGGAGDDIVQGDEGNDDIDLGEGDDTFRWRVGSGHAGDPGDGSDMIDGGLGNDTLSFDDTDSGDGITLSAGGGHAFASHDATGFSLDLVGIDTIAVKAFGGADTITVGDLTGTDVTQVIIDLTKFPSVSIPDGEADTIVIHGTGDDDAVDVTSEGGNIIVTGFAAEVRIQHADAALDTLVLDAGDGGDEIDASELPVGSIGLVLDGDAGDDTLIGSAGADTLIGGEGSDVFRFVALGAADTIDDFIAADDTIELDQGIFTALGLDELDETAFHVVGQGGLTEDHRIIYDQASGKLFYDADGSGAGAAIHFAKLVNKPVNLTHADFVVV